MFFYNPVYSKLKYKQKLREKGISVVTVSSKNDADSKQGDPKPDARGEGKEIKEKNFKQIREVQLIKSNTLPFKGDMSSRKSYQESQ